MTTCVPTNNPIIYIKNAFNIMPIWKYIHAMCVRPISSINVIFTEFEDLKFIVSAAGQWRENASVKKFLH